MREIVNGLLRKARDPGGERGRERERYDDDDGLLERERELSDDEQCSHAVSNIAIHSLCNCFLIHNGWSETAFSSCVFPHRTAELN